MAKDPDQEMLSEERRLDLRFNIEENATRREEQLKILRDLTDFDYSPEKRRSDSISAWMRGVGKGGTGLVYGSMAMANEESKQRRELYARRLKELELDNANIAANVDSLNKVSTIAGNLYSSIVKDRRAAIALASVIPERDLEAYDKAYSAESARLDSGVKNELSALKIEATSEFNKIQDKIARAANDTNKIALINKGLANLTKQEAKIAKDIAARPKYGVPLDAARKASDLYNDDGTNKANEKQRAMVINYLADVESERLKQGTEVQRKAYEAILKNMIKQ